VRKESRLSAFLEDLDWSPDRLAREVNRRYGDGTVSAKAPYGWAKGAYPRGQVAGFVATILSDQLGRVVDIGQIWPDRASQPERAGDFRAGLPWSEEQIERILRPLVEQGGPEKGRTLQPVPGTVLVSLAVDWLTAERLSAAERADGAELAPEMLDMLFGRIAWLRRLGDSQDGVLVLNWVVHELRWARHLTGSPAFGAATGRQLYRALAQLATLAGRLAADHGRPVQGQHYLLAALRAASLAGDRALGAYILTCLSHHLTRCGDAQDAQRLLRLACAGTGAGTPEGLRALLADQEAQWGWTAVREAAHARPAAGAAGLADDGRHQVGGQRTGRPDGGPSGRRPPPPAEAVASMTAEAVPRNRAA
jgi:hypothetical protein